MRRFGLILLVAGLLAGTTGCRMPWPRSAPARETSAGSSTTLLDQQLLETIERERQLDTVAAGADADSMEVQRRFQQVARDYASLIARNPEHLETRLLYGKLLSRYGDAEGAREQFLIAAKIDPNVAVIHQQLSTYYAEQGDFTRALAYALNALRLEPQTAAYHFGLGQVLAAFRQEFLDEQVFSSERLDTDLLAAFQTAAQLEPATLPLQFRYGEAFYDVDNPDWNTALAHWQALFQNPALSQLQQDAVRLHQARCLIELGRPVEARALAEAVQSPQLRNSAQALGL
ncbi:MAG: tetratricopeptide repeat protein [Oceanipulchritudo sp.]